MSHTRTRDICLRMLKLERSYRPSILVRNAEWNFDSPLALSVGALLRTNSDFVFVQVGGFDGNSADPIFPLVERYGIRGVIVEPQAGACDMLRVHYRNYPQVAIEQMAISAADEVRDFYTVCDGPSPLSSFDRGNLVKHKVPAHKIVRTQVQCCSLASLLRKHDIPHLGLLQIDAEGADYEIIKSIDFRTTRPSLLRFEHVHLSDADCDACVAMLHGHGYQFMTEKRDVLAIHADEIGVRRQAA